MNHDSLMVDVIGYSSSIFDEDCLNMNDLNKASSLERSQESKYGFDESSRHGVYDLAAMAERLSIGS